MKQKPQTVRATGIAWFRQEEYARFRKLFSDGNKLPPTYKQWLKRAEKALKELRSRGSVVEKVYLDIDTFPGWCHSHGLNIDANARTRFASEAVARKYQHTH